MLKKIVFILIFLITIYNGFAQTDENWYLGKKIKDIKFEGLKTISANEVNAIVKNYVNQEFNDTLFWDIQSKLYALDYFEDITPNAIPGDDNFSTVIIEFKVVEHPIIQEIKLKGNKSIRKGEILDSILLKEDDMVTKTKIKLDAESIKELYVSKGFPTAEVRGEIEEDDKEKGVEVVFYIDEGSQTRIGEVVFSGNSFASDSSLKKIMKTKKQAVLNKGIYQETQIEEDIDSIEKYYHERGYVDAKVVKTGKEVISTEEKKGKVKNELKITFFIQEGNQYIYTGIDFEGNTLFTREEIMAVVRQKPGKILNSTKLEADFTRVVDLYYNDGYIFNEIAKKPIKNEEKHEIKYMVYIKEKGRAHVENIIVKGNTKTKDYVIVREIPLETGDVFSKEKIFEAYRNLYNLQYFSSVAAEPVAGSTEGLMDLIFNVEEGKTTVVNFGLTFSGAGGEFPVIGFLKWTDNNFFGRGQEFSAMAEYSFLRKTFGLSFNERWFMGKRINLGFDVSISSIKSLNILQDFDSIYGVPDPYLTLEQYEDAIDNGTINTNYLMEYETIEYSFGIHSGYRFYTPIGRLNTSGGIIISPRKAMYDPDINRPYEEEIRENLNTWNYANKLWTLFAFDTRDYIYNPSKGYLLSQKFTFAGGFLGGQTHFIKSISKAEWYYKLFDFPVSETWSFKYVFAAQTALYQMFPQFGMKEIQSQPLDEFFIDGMSLARGWMRQNELEAMYDLTFELRMPIFEQALWWDWFLQATAPFEDRDDLTSLTLDDFRCSMGFGIRFTIPGLPIGLYFVKRFYYESNHFSSVEWINDGIFEDSLGMGFVIAFTVDMF